MYFYNEIISHVLCITLTSGAFLREINSPMSSIEK